MERKKGDFTLPVDSEHKAAVFKPWEFRGVHMRAFHASWLSFFVSFLSTFAPAALSPVIREDLNLTTNDLGAAGIAAVTGVIAARVMMGVLCDTLGPRYGHAGIILTTAPAMFAMALVTGPTGFIICRFFVGFSLATFIACQYWSSVMFNVQIVGVANATGAGWGNAGGGVSQILMPILFHALENSFESFSAWRFALLIPGSLHIVIGFVILAFAQDMPDGSFFYLRSQGDMAGPQVWKAFGTGLSNWKTWQLAWLYGYSFGIELTVNNIIVAYFFDHFDISFRVAGVLASMFGLLNLFARSIGGTTSDQVANTFGMRGRLTVFWLIQTFEGLMCLLVGLSSHSLLLTVFVIALFSITVQASEGACYGIVPFVSKRALGVVTGVVGAGGNLGSMIMTSLFFRTESLEVHTGFILMGATVMVMSQLTLFVYFPMWGGIFAAPKPNYTEEDYYLAEYTEEEIAQGLANASIVYASETKSQRGGRRLIQEEETANAQRVSGVNVYASSARRARATELRTL
ncbi:hypothetical protein BSKO_11510 [Bryopsis sp. KO-2023]|nr:hypothetical protein BSKO_11510 [Bryopsis sp. KO-2023]